METPRSVLIVDDDPHMREMLASLLEEDGIEVACAASTEEALAAARGDGFDAILSDIRMPRQDGFELLRELRNLDHDAPVIMMTSFGSVAVLSRALQEGAFDYLMKPFTRHQLRSALERAFAG